MRGRPGTPTRSQALLVTAGARLRAERGGPVREIGPLDIFSCPTGEKHWHGGTPGNAMTHVAITEALDGKAGSIGSSK